MGKRAKQVTVGYRYYMGLHLVVCQGRQAAVQEIRIGERTVFGSASRQWFGIAGTSIDINLPDLFGGNSREGGVVGRIDILSGDRQQPRNDYLMGQLGANIPAFRGVLSLVARKIMFAANNPYMKPWAIRVMRTESDNTDWIPNAPPNIVTRDGNFIGMNPAAIICDCIVNKDWGMGYPGTIVGRSFIDAAQTLAAEGFGLNLLWTRQQTIEQFVTLVLDHINGVLYVDPEAGQLQLRLVRDDYQIEDLPTLGPQQIVRMERFERPQLGDLPNAITVVYTDWDSGGEATVEVQNPAGIHAQGGVVAQRRDYPGVSDPELAARLALRDLRILGAPLARLSMIVAGDALARIPLPGDVVLLSWPRLGIDQMVVRIVNVDAGALGSAEWRIDAVEDAFGIDDAVLSPPAPAIGEPAYEPLPPAAVTAVEAAYWDLARNLSRAELSSLTDTDTYLGALAAASGSAGQLNWNLIIDGTVVGTGHYAPLFVLDQPLPEDEADATVSATAVSFPERLATDGYAYLIDAAGRIREAVAILGYNPTAGTMSIARGVLDTTPQAHPSGTRLIGATGWQAFDTTERAPGESATVGAIPRSFAGVGEPVFAEGGAHIDLVGRQARPYPPGFVRINGEAYPTAIVDAVQVSWAHRDRTLQTAYFVRQYEGHIGPEPGTTYTLYIYNENDTLQKTVTGLTTTSWTYPTADEAADSGLGRINGKLRIEIESVRGEYASWQRQIRRIERAGYGLNYDRYYGGL